MLKKLLCVVMLLLVSATAASAGTGRGKGSCIFCHQNGVPVGTGISGCGGCHLNPPATAAHRVHTDGSGALYGSDSNASLTGYRFNCGNCHPSAAAKHGNGPTEVELYNPAATGFKRLNPPSAASSGSGGATVCSNIYCHSAGQPVAGNSYAATPAWGAGFGGNSCAGCHSYPPDYANNAPKPNSHVQHEFGCDTCHAGTTVDGTSVNPSLHVNSSIDLAPGAGVSFSYSYAPGGGTCSTISCHANTDATWGGTAVCTACHGNPPPQAAYGYTGVDENLSPHRKHAGQETNYSYNCSECHKGNKHGNGSFQDVFLLKTDILAGAGAGYNPVARSCSTVYCHSDGAPFDRPTVYKEPTWSGTLPADCTGCHGGNAQSSVPMLTGKHGEHVNQPGIGYACGTCHSATVSADNDRLVSQLANHVDGVKTIAFQGGGSYGSATRSCSATDCHQAGKPQAPQPATPAWNGAPLGCNGCHGMRNALGVPDYPSAGPGQALANSHEKHVAGSTSSTDCASCHYRTVSAALSGTLRSYSSLHLNRVRDVDFSVSAGIQGRYSSASQQCMNTYCHGAAPSPRWGASSLSCDSCHAAQASSFALNHAGAHEMHYQVNTPPAPGSYATMPAGPGPEASASSYQFNCSSCHAAPAGHANGEAVPGGSAAQVYFGYSLGQLKGDYLYGAAQGTDNGFQWSNGSCVGTYCHSDGSGGPAKKSDFGWGSPQGTLGCNGCHGASAAAGSAISSGKHGAHINNAALLGSNLGCAECHAKTVDSDSHIKNKLQHVNRFKDYSGARAGGSASYSAATGVCSASYCHSDGKGRQKTVSWQGGGTLDCRGCHGSDSAPAFASSPAGEPNYANSGQGTPRANSHRGHTAQGAASCDACHTGTSATGLAINAGSTLHLNGSINVSFNAAKSGAAVTWNAASKTCDNISCHGNASARWGGSSCLGCHSLVQGSRAAITDQFGSGSHHIQGTLSDDKCYQCHWEANSDGSVNSTYHAGSAQPGAQIDLVVYGAGSRPESYSAASAVQYTANGSRSEIAKINTHCIGCHSDQNNTTTPFGDGKTPREYAWDGTSVATRYGQTGATTWGKYPTVANAAQKNIAKAFSAHGNSAANKRGWSSTTGVDGAISDTGASAGVQCYDCHNSHGSQAVGVLTRYSSATGNKRGGILKSTVAGKGGYSIGYSPTAGGSPANKDSRNPGASLCLDCHLNQTAQSTPWGFGSTYGATQPVLGYFDAFMGYSTSGAEQRFPYKKQNKAKGGHFGASSALSSSPMATVDGLCTPCHDPHGVSPTLGANQQYAVPLLKGTWVTSPYKEDAPPPTNDWLNNFAGYGPGVHYHIDQNTFGTSIRATVAGMTQTLDQSAGLCLSCHPKETLTAQATASNPNPWKSKNRVHESVKGWKNSNGIVKHNYSCSKCHSAHTSNLLPRLMVTNCLDGQHKGRMGFNPAPVTSGSSGGDGGGGSGRIPGSYGGGGWENFGDGLPGLSPPDDVTVACHESATANGPASGGTDQGWNSVTPWSDATPTITMGPAVSTSPRRVMLHMDESQWTGAADEVRDASWGNNHGTSYYATSVAGGITGRAGYFNTSYGNVTIKYATGSAPVDSFSVEAWVKPTISHEIDAEMATGAGGVYGQRYLFWPDQKGPVDAGMGISVGTNGISVYEHGDGYMPALAVYQGSISSSQWSHLAVVYNNKRPSIYLNGVLVRTGLQSTRAHVHAPRVIGSGSYGYFPGYVDEVAIYGAANSAADVLAHSQLNYSALCASASATVLWSTIVPGSSQVEYGLSTGYGLTVQDATQTKSHSLTLPDLQVGATYHYRVRSVNGAGQEAVSGDNSFVMMGCSEPTAPALAATGISALPGNGEATVSFTAGSGATSSLIRYGTTSGVYPYSLDPATSPQTITGLSNDVPLYYQVGAKNDSGTTWSAQYTVTPIAPAQPPSAISATAGNGSATIYWTAGAGSTASLIRYGSASGVYGTTVDPATSPRTITGLTNGQTTYYQVGAKNAAGTTWSAEYSVALPAPPQAPTAISALAGSTQATISWSAGIGATSSLIRYGTTSGVYPSTIDPALSPRIITGLVNGVTVYYQVGAKNAQGTTWSTQYSVTPVGPPQAPSAITSSAVSGQITVSWSAGAGSTSSLLQWGTVSGSYPNSIDPASSPHVISGLSNGVRVYFRVGAKNAQGTTWSAQNSAVPVAAPQPPTSVTALPGNGQATISWSPGSGAASSTFRYGTTSGSYTTTLATATSPLTITGLANTTLYYQVGAVNGSGTTWSVEYSVLPTASAPTAATAVSAVPGYYQATFSWTPGSGATSSLLRYGYSSGNYAYTRTGVSSPYIQTGLSSTVYYQIGSVNASGTTWSSQYTVTPSASAPMSPFAVGAVPGNGQATISWSAGYGATSSLIRYGTASGVYTAGIDPAVSPRTITGLSNGSPTYYRVASRNAYGTTWSEEFSVVAGAPATPVPVTTDYSYYSSTYEAYHYRYYNSDCLNQNQVTLAWNPVTSPDGDPVEYQVTLNGLPLPWQSATSYTLLADPGAGYSWTVKARDAVHTANESPNTATLLYELSTSCGGSSCPLVYSFDGSGFSYETDVQGPSLSQAKKGARNVTLYGPSYLVLDKLAPDQSGQYRVKLWESLQEAAIVDEAKLLAVDYPEGYQLVSSSAENTYYYGYADPFTIYTVKDPVLPVSATDKNGQDVLAQASAVDDRPAPMVPEDPDNYYTFDFGSIAHPEHAKLVIDGWQDINSKLYLSTVQVQPYVEVLDASGAWVKVKSFGMPAGDLKTMVVDLSNLFLNQDDQRVRLHLGIKKAQIWLLDRIRLDDSAPVAFTVQEVPMSGADLQVGGHVVQSMPTQEHRLLTTELSPAPSMNNFGYGNFTRLGDVTELLAQRDDKYAVMNYADVIDMAFPALPAPESGAKRGFILKADLYYKEFKDYKYLDPLPFHAMSDYPYLAPEVFPSDAEHQQYLTSYNTRVFSAPAAPVLISQASPLYSSGPGAELALQWNAASVPDGDSVQYQVEVSALSDFSTIAYQSSWQNETAWSQALPVGTWYWRVKARDSLHPIVLVTSAPGSFSIADRTPAAPAVTDEPDTVTSGAGATVELQWQAVLPPDGDGAEYLVEVSDAPDFVAVASNSGWLAAPGWSVNLPAGTWYWRVTARDSAHSDAVSSPSASDAFSVIGD